MFKPNKCDFKITAGDYAAAAAGNIHHVNHISHSSTTYSYDSLLAEDDAENFSREDTVTDIVTKEILL